MKVGGRVALTEGEVDTGSPYQRKDEAIEIKELQPSNLAQPYIDKRVPANTTRCVKLCFVFLPNFDFFSSITSMKAKSTGI